jgi:hypothetical protein
MPLTREQISQASDLQRETVNVPEWGGDVVLGTMSGLERDEFEEWVAKQPEDIRLRPFMVKLLTIALRNADGSRMFPPGDGAMADLGSKSDAALSRLYEVAVKLNKIGGRQEDTELGKSAGVPGVSSS